MMSSMIFADTEMALTVTGKGENVISSLCSRPSSRVMWVSRERGADGNPVRTRVPEQTVTVFETPSFTAAGKQYSSTAELSSQEAEGNLYTDCYGRTVVYMSEGFPCFDSYDEMYENRRYRWWLIVEPERLTRVYTEDDVKKIYVTEDVCQLENRCVPAMTRLGLIIKEGE